MSLLRQYLSLRNLHIVVTDTYQDTLWSPSDAVIMQPEHLNQYTDAHQQDLNLVRMYLQISELSDMLDPYQPNKIALHFLDAVKPPNFVLNHRWSRHEQPPRVKDGYGNLFWCPHTCATFPILGRFLHFLLPNRLRLCRYPWPRIHPVYETWWRNYRVLNGASSIGLKRNYMLHLTVVCTTIQLHTACCSASLEKTFYTANSGRLIAPWLSDLNKEWIGRLRFCSISSHFSFEVLVCTTPMLIQMVYR